MTRQPTTITSSSDPGWAFVELGRIVLGEEPLGAVLTRVAVLAVDVIPAVNEASVTLMEDGRPRSIAFTGSHAGTLDERQYETGWGPCLDAAATGETVAIETSDPASSPYPDFAAVAQRAGVVQAVSVGLPIAERVVGAVNLYSWSGDLDTTAIALAEKFAGYAAVAVTNAARYSTTSERAENMAAAMQSRAVIEQAKGIVMATQRCDAEDAFAYLVKVSQRRNRKLREVAAALVESTAAGGNGQKPAR